MCDEVFSSGTTGKTFVTVRGHLEQGFIRAFYTEIYRDTPPARFTRALQINNPFHAFQVSLNQSARGSS